MTKEVAIIVETGSYVSANIAWVVKILNQVSKQSHIEDFFLTCTLKPIDTKGSRVHHLKHFNNSSIVLRQKTFFLSPCHDAKGH